MVIETLEFFVPSNRKNKNGRKQGMDGMNEIVKQSRAKAAWANIRKNQNEQWVAGFARDAMKEAGWKTADCLHTVILTFIEPDMRRDDDNIFEVVLGKDGGSVDLADCEFVHRAVLAAFDRNVEDYSLTVGSQGMDAAEADAMLRDMDGK